jgi:hypothetical protein
LLNCCPASLPLKLPTVQSEQLPGQPFWGLFGVSKNLYLIEYKHFTTKKGECSKMRHFLPDLRHGPRLGGFEPGANQFLRTARPMARLETPTTKGGGYECAHVFSPSVVPGPSAQTARENYTKRWFLFILNILACHIVLLCQDGSVVPKGRVL